MKKIVIINQKGGVGKSTISVNLSYALSDMGKNTLVLDLDPQANSSIIFFDLENSLNKGGGGTVKELLLSKTYNVYNTIYPAIINGGKIDNLFIIPSNIGLSFAAEQVTSKIHKEKIIHNHLKKIESDYDFMLLDCPPNLGVLTVNAIYTADLLLIPTIYAKYSLDGIADLFDTIAEVRETELYNYRILRNHFDVRNKSTNRFIDNELKPYNKNLINTIIRKTESLNQAQANEETIFTYDPNSNGTEDFILLAKELISYAEKEGNNR